MINFKIEKIEEGNEKCLGIIASTSGFKEQGTFNVFFEWKDKSEDLIKLLLPALDCLMAKFEVRSK